MLYKIKKIKAISPLIATILLVVIAVILVTVIMSFGQSFTAQGLDKTKDIKELSRSDAELFIYPKSFSDGVMQFNYNPPNNSYGEIQITKYKILYDNDETEEIVLDSPCTLNTGTNLINLKDFTTQNVPSRKFTLILETADNKCITLKNITNPYPYVESEELSSDKLIISFDISEYIEDIDNDNNTVSLTVPNGTDVTALTPTITLSENATINPLSGVAQNFTSPVTYTVTAEDSTTRIYTVTVNVEEPPEESCSLIPESGEIYYLEHLDYIDTNATTLAASYTLQRDLNFLDDDSYCQPDTYKTSWTTGTGWDPIGSDVYLFSGSFDGNNHKISNLYINRPTTDYIGLFSYLGYNATSGAITNLGLEDINVIGKDTVGGLVSYIVDEATIQKCYSTGSVSGAQYIGGLFGFGSGGVIIVQNSYSTCSVSGNTIIGGLGGYLNTGEITKCYSTGLVSGSASTGGLIGDVDQGYATSSYWDMNTSGKTTSASGTGKTTSQMKTQSTFTGWDFTTVWNISGATYPYLRNNTELLIPSITSPTDGQIYYHDQWSVNLIGTAINPQGDYTCSWSSSIEGSLGSGCNINTNFSTEGTHIITLSVTDDYQTKETSILITITNAPAAPNPFR